LAARLGVSDRVYLPGLCRDVAQLLSACDIFVLASDWEGVPVAVIEAMAARLPVVATAVGGVGELVEADVTGILVPPGDAQALAGALADLAGDPERRLGMGERGRRRAERFDASVMVASYARLFERLCGGHA
jgi:glycosyltransferase involved in cell wall biosynthesis